MNLEYVKWIEEGRRGEPPLGSYEDWQKNHIFRGKTITFTDRGRTLMSYEDENAPPERFEHISEDSLNYMEALFDLYGIHIKLRKIFIVNRGGGYDLISLGDLRKEQLSGVDFKHFRGVANE
jgi:hypothetical protein